MMGDGEETLPANTQDYDGIPTAERIAASADAMEELNRFLWQIAKGVGIVAATLFFLFMVFMMYLLAKAGWGFLA